MTKRKIFDELMEGVGAMKKHRAATRWEWFSRRQVQDARLRDLVKRELDNLQLGAQIAKLQDAENLSQTGPKKRKGTSPGRQRGKSQNPKP
jgi:hypothetical protein